MVAGVDVSAQSRDVVDAAPPRRARWAEQLLGIFVLYHAAAVVMMSIPDPGAGMVRSAWRDPTVQHEFRVWAATLSSVGAGEVTPAALEERLWAFAVGFVGWRSAIVRPFDLYGDVVGVRQPWRMFVAPHRFPTLLVVELEEAGVWRPIYVDRSAEFTWREGQFSHDRMRAAIFRYGWPRYRRSYEQLAGWIAGQAAVDFPTATRARVLMIKRRTPTPEEVRAGKRPREERQQAIVLKLDEMEARRR